MHTAMETLTMKDLSKPENLYDREAEWKDLTRFACAPSVRLRLGLVYGRRRYGKSYLLRRLVETLGGVYHLALREEPRPSLNRFTNNLTRQIQWTPQAPFQDWFDALIGATTALGSSGTQPKVLVIDEYPYLQQNNLELESALQAVMDEASAGELTKKWTAPVSVILCGSAMSAMTQLLSGTSPLRGRAVLDMPLNPFDFRQSRDYWGIQNPAVAFNVDTVVGGAPGYKDLTSDMGIPRSPAQFTKWITSTVLNPSHVLFREDEYLLREDPRVTNEATYYSLLQAVADGRSTPAKIASALAKSANDFSHHLKVMTSAGFVVRHHDLLAVKRPIYRVADPIVRFHHLINRRHRARLEDRQAAEVWADTSNTYRSQILGPHFETLCRFWIDKYASEATLGGETEQCGSVQIHDRRQRLSFELDVVALKRGAHAETFKTIQIVGEAKAHRLDPSALERLDRLVDHLASRSNIIFSPTAKRILFSLRGFTPTLTTVAKSRSDVELVDLQRLYEGE